MQDEFLLNQLVKLGDMMGDGLHHEPDGKWIEREYRQIAKALYPEMYKRKPRKPMSEDLKNKIIELVANNKCSCGGSYAQKRKGTRKMYCTSCNQHYTIKTKKVKA